MRISFATRLFGRAVGLAGVLTAASGWIQGQELRVVAPHQHGPALLRQVREDGTAESYNWSGYAVTGANGSVTAASGSWLVPQTSCSPGDAPAYASFWVGIDGWTSNTVEQIGTDSDCVDGIATYYAWFEFYPEPAYYAGAMTNLTPGHLMSAKVIYNAARGAFIATITDESEPDYTFTTAFKPNKYTGIPQQSSAEWIAEAPSDENGNILPLPNFGVVSFGDYFTGIPQTNFATVGGVTGPIGSFGSNVWTSTMVSGDAAPMAYAPMATPSRVFKNSSFWITWYSVGP